MANILPKKTGLKTNLAHEKYSLNKLRKGIAKKIASPVKRINNIS
jgi:hypothetical protein